MAPNDKRPQQTNNVLCKDGIPLQGCATSDCTYLRLPVVSSQLIYCNNCKHMTECITLDNEN